MNYRALRQATCCALTAVTLTAGSVDVWASPIAGSTGFTSVNVTSELTASSPNSGISLLLSQYLAENTISSDQVAKETTGAQIVTASESAEETEETEGVVEEETKESKKEKKVMIVADVEGYVNVRARADEDSKVLGKLYDESVGTVLKEKNGWYKIESGNVTGFVKADYVKVATKKFLKKVGERVATVDTQTLRVREKADGDSKVIELVPEGEELTVVSESKKDKGWVKVTVEGGDGYVSTDYVDLSTEYTYAESKEEEAARLAAEEAERLAAAEAAQQSASSSSSSGSSSSSSSSSGSSSSSSSEESSYSAPSGSNGQAVANYACQFVGNPYRYGGSSLTDGTDCSGFVMSVYAAFGVSLPHSSSALRSCGYGVSIDDIQPGDIVCYSGHVGIYAGNNTLVHASSPETGIKYTSPITYRTVLAVRRIF